MIIGIGCNSQGVSFEFLSENMWLNFETNALISDDVELR